MPRSLIPVLVLILWATLNEAAGVDRRTGNGQNNYALVETRDGRSLNGYIEFKAGHILLRTNDATSLTIHLPDLTLLRFIPPPPPPVIQYGLRASYFRNAELIGPPLLRRDRQFNFNWGENAPIPTVPRDGFSIRWEADLRARHSGAHTFELEADDGARLWINDQLVIDAWEPPAGTPGPPGNPETNPPENPTKAPETPAAVDTPEVPAAPEATTPHATVEFEAEKPYALKLEFRDHEGPAHLRLFWKEPGATQRVIVPPDRFQPKLTRKLTAQQRPPTNGVLALYFNSTNFSGTFKAMTNPVINFNWETDFPTPGIRTDQFSVRWSGRLHPALAGDYRFHVEADDGARLWIDGRPIIDRWDGTHFSEDSDLIRLEAGKVYALRMDMFENRQGAIARLYWTPPGQPREIIPARHLTPLAAPNPARMMVGTHTGIQLRDGSFLAGRIEAMDKTSARLRNNSGESVMLRVNVARIHLKGFTLNQKARLKSGRTGLMLTNGDFLDGEVRRIRDDRVALNSVVLGLRQYPIEEITVILLHETAAAPADFEVLTRDGSLLLANRLALLDGKLRFEDGVLAGMPLPQSNVLEIKATTAPVATGKE